MRDFIVILFLLLVSTPALACELLLPESEVIRALQPPVPGPYVTCDKDTKEPCYCFDGIDPWIGELVDNMVVDFVRKDHEVSCADQADCDVKFQSLVCDLGSPIKNYDSLSVYCAVEALKKDGMKVVNSEAKRAARAAQEQAKAQMEAAMASAAKAMECGKTAQQLVLVRNAQKNLTKPQVKQLVETYSVIKNLLDSGSLATAIDEIQTVTADGVVITEDDKAALIGHIQSCKP
jgi:hypothetical protein